MGRWGHVGGRGVGGSCRYRDIGQRLLLVFFLFCFRNRDGVGLLSPKQRLFFPVIGFAGHLRQFLLLNGVFLFLSLLSGNGGLGGQRGLGNDDRDARMLDAGRRNYYRNDWGSFGGDWHFDVPDLVGNAIIRVVGLAISNVVDRFVESLPFFLAMQVWI